MRKVPFNLTQQEDEFLYAIKNNDEIDLDMKQRENQKDSDSNSQNQNNSNIIDNEFESFDENNDDEQEENKKSNDNNFENLGSDYISLF